MIILMIHKIVKIREGVKYLVWLVSHKSYLKYFELYLIPFDFVRNIIMLMLKNLDPKGNVNGRFIKFKGSGHKLEWSNV